MAHRIRRFSIPTGLAVALALALGAPLLFTATADGNGSLVGTWYVTFPNPTGAGGNIPVVTTFHRDGTWASSDGTDFGGVPFGQDSPIRGVWGRAGGGPGQFEGIGLVISANSISGNVEAIARIRVDVAFADDFDHLGGTVFTDIFFCPTPFTCPDPFTADPDVSFPITVQGQRLRLE